VGPLGNQALTKVYFVGAFSFRSNLHTFYQFPAKFCVFRGKTGVNGGEGMELLKAD
jgi:hypothetical protein